MALVSDSWFVRLPDGRVVLAKSTRAVKHHLHNGTIPAASRVRRAPGDEWEKLENFPEFAKYLEPNAHDTPPTRDRDPEAPAMGRSMEFRPLGIGGLANELFNALDTSLHRHKLWIAGLTSLAWAIGFLLLLLMPRVTDGVWLWVYRGSIAMVLLPLAGLASAILGQMSLIEMSQFRPARWREVRPGLIGKALRITIGQALIVAVVYVPIVVLRRFPAEWSFGDSTPEAVVGALLALRLFLQTLLWPIVGMSLLLAPVLIVEECSLWSGLWQWWGILRSDLSRIFLYETLATALGLVLTAPLMLPVLYAAWNMGTFDHDFQSAVGLATLHVFGGLAVTPLVAFLLVANVFIYLNLRYEFLFPNR